MNEIARSRPTRKGKHWPEVVFVNAPLRQDNFNCESLDEIVEADVPVIKLYRARAKTCRELYRR